jgi:hypothetical protein
MRYGILVFAKDQASAVLGAIGSKLKTLGNVAKSAAFGTGGTGGTNGAEPADLRVLAELGLLPQAASEFISTATDAPILAHDSAQAARKLLVAGGSVHEQ